MEKEKKKFSFIYDEIPEGYKEYLKIDLLKQRNTVRTLSRLEIIMAGLMFLLGLNIVPLSSLFHGENTVIREIVAVGSFFAFVMVREVVHAVIMSMFGVNAVFIDAETGDASISEKSYFKKKAYAVITVLPIILLGIILIIICAMVPSEAFWCVYPALIANFAGSSSDYYVLYLFTKTPADSIVLDEATALTFYSRQEKTETS